MYHNFVFSDVNQALPELLHRLDKDGAEVGSRAGRTKELTHVGITLLNPTRREIIIPQRKASIAAQIAETVWVLAGHNDIGWLGHYLPRAKDFSDDGVTWRAGYGKRLRSWPRRSGGSVDPIDQIRWVVDLLRRDPSSRQAVASIWDPQIDTAPGKDIPCNDWLSFSSRLGQLDLHVALRSNDVIWGWSGINQFEWSTLLEVVAGLLGVKPGSLHFSTTSFHIYDRHWAKAAKIVSACSVPQLAPAADSPRFDANALPHKDIEGLDEMLGYWLELEKAIRHGEDVDADVDAFPEPMFRSWLRVLQWWWTGDRDYLQPLQGTALELATHYSVQPKTHAAPKAAEESVASATGDPSHFIRFAVATHIEKDAAYGDSWKRRGELLAILPNVARKVDRLGGGETSDETSADTAMDLMVYLAKYLVWLGSEGMSDTPDEANRVLFNVDGANRGQDLGDTDAITERLKHDFETLTELAMKKLNRADLVCDMLNDAYRLARQLWDAEKAVADEYRGADVD